MRRRRLYKAARVLVLLQIAVGLTPAGFGLCIAADGHTALEVAHDGLPCLQEVRRHHPDDAAVDAREIARHPCRCVPLLDTPPFRSSGSMRSALLRVAAFAPFALAPVISPGGPSPVPGPWTLPFAVRSRALRSVVLLV